MVDITKKLLILKNDKWLPVFCHKDGQVITCENSPGKALPTMAHWGADDLAFFRAKFAGEQFKIGRFEK